MHNPTRRALFSSRSLRLTLTAGCLALAALAGCAPVDGASGSVEPASLDALTPTAASANTAAREASPWFTEVAPGALTPSRQDLRGDLLLHTDLTAPGSTLAPVAAPAPSVERDATARPTEVAPSPLTPVHQDLRTSLLRPTLIDDGVIVPTLDRAFDPGTFSDAVSRAGAEYLPGVAALPNVEVLSTDAMETALFNVVRRSVTDPRAEISSVRPSCGERADDVCAERFLRVIGDLDGQLARELAPYARQLRVATPELELTLWSSRLDGEVTPVAVTLHGRHHDGLVGVIVFQ